MRDNTEGDSCTAVGKSALLLNTTGDYNTAVGKDAVRANTTGTRNTGLGYRALYPITTGNDNTGVGYQALYGVTTANDNTAVGSYALEVNTTGAYNTCIGKNAGQSVTTGSNNNLFGLDAGRSASPSGNITTGSNIVCLGNNNTTDLYCADTSISSSDARDKTDVEDFKYGLSWIKELRPVTYRWDKRSWYGDDENPKGTPDGSKKGSRINIGFLAQEAIEVEKKFGYGDKKDNFLIANQDEDEADPSYGYKYERLVPVLVNAIKELKAENDELRSLIKDSKTFASLKSSINN